MFGEVDGVAAVPKLMWVQRGSRLHSKKSQILGAQHPVGARWANVPWQGRPCSLHEAWRLACSAVTQRIKHPDPGSQKQNNEVTRRQSHRAEHGYANASIIAVRGGNPRQWGWRLSRYTLGKPFHSAVCQPFRGTHKHSTRGNADGLQR